MDQSVTRAEALELMLGAWKPDTVTEFVTLENALGRVTASAHYSCISLPVYRVSSFDGIAVKSADFEDGVPDPSKWVKGRDYAQADTGDDFPDEFDSIIDTESLILDENRNILRFVDGFEFEKGDGVRPAAAAVKNGELLVGANVKLSPLHLAVLAMGGVHQVEVIRKPKVVYIPTGNELIPAGLKPQRGQNIQSNGVMVAGYLSQWGAEPVCFPIIRDEPEELERALDDALKIADIVLINGGSSMGAEDYNAVLLQRIASLYRHGIKCRPGKPVAFALIDGKAVINIPGPTLAAYLALDWFVSALVSRFLNQKPAMRHTMTAKLAKPIKKEAEWEMYSRFVLKRGEDGDYIAEAIGREGTQPSTLTAPHAVAFVPMSTTAIAVGESLEVELLCGLEALPQ